MELEKIRNLNESELKQEERQAQEQLFRLRFQAKLGQTEGVKKIRGLRKDVARLKTIARQRELGIAPPSTAAATPASKTRKGSR